MNIIILMAGSTKDFEEKGYLIKEKLAPRVDYIDIVNKYGGI